MGSWVLEDRGVGKDDSDSKGSTRRKGFLFLVPSIVQNLHLGMMGPH